MTPTHIKSCVAFLEEHCVCWHSSVLSQALFGKIQYSAVNNPQVIAEDFICPYPIRPTGHIIGTVQSCIHIS